MALFIDSLLFAGDMQYFAGYKFVLIDRTDYKKEGPADEDVLLQLLSGREQEAYQAYTSLYEYYYGILYTYIFPFARLSAIETKEIIQVVFVKLWLKRDTLAGVAHFRQYLFRMARNTVIDLQRQRQRQEKREGLVAGRSEERVYAVETELALKEYHHIARQAIELLPARRKAIFLLRTAGDLSLEEIGQELDVSKDVVKKQLYQAVDFIKKQLRQKGDLIFFILIVPFL